MRRLGLWTVGLAASALAHLAVAVALIALLQPDEVDQQPRPESKLEVASQSLDRQAAPEGAAEADSAAEAARDETALSSGTIRRQSARTAPADALDLNAAAPAAAPISAAETAAEALRPAEADRPRLAASAARAAPAALAPAPTQRAPVADAVPAQLGEVPARAETRPALAAIAEPASAAVAQGANLAETTAPAERLGASEPQPLAVNALEQAAAPANAAAMSATASPALSARAEPVPSAPPSPGVAVIATQPRAARIASGVPAPSRPIPPVPARVAARPLKAAAAPVRTSTAIAAPRVTAASVALSPVTAQAIAAPPPERVAASAAPAAQKAALSQPAPIASAVAEPAALPARAAPVAPSPALLSNRPPDQAAVTVPEAPVLPVARPRPAALPDAAPPLSEVPQAIPATRPVAASPPDAAAIKAILAFPGGGENVDPISLAAFQSFVAPEQAQDQAPGLRDALAGLLGSVPCSRLQVVFDPETVTLRIDGHVPDGEAKAPVLDALQGRMGSDIAVEDNMLILPEPQCGVLAGVESTGLPQSTDQITNPLVVGDDAHAKVFRFLGGQDFVLEATAPDYDAHIYVDYFDTGGNVLHLSPNESVPLIRARSKSGFVLDPYVDSGQAFRLQIGAPYGQDIAVAFAASRPLYEGVRPIVEPAAPYLDWLRDRVSEARASDPDFKGEWIYFFVATAPP